MSIHKGNAVPWASFCMSTFNRPEFLRSQLASLLQQNFKDFEIIVADNDPEAGGKTIVESFDDSRIKYECNGTNIGMLKSFNRSIQRSLGSYIVMVTDDDPVDHDFLRVFQQIIRQYPGHSLYGGLKRAHTKEGEIEIIKGPDFIKEFLNFDKTTEVLWSSCIIERKALMQIGMLPDYGSPHLVDHALVAMAGSIDGAVIVNKMYSKIVLHQTNFSKSNFDYYLISCTGFYNLLKGFAKSNQQFESTRKIIIAHLGKWFIVSIFNLLNHYSSADNYNKKNLDEIKAVSRKILQLEFMRSFRLKYHCKLFILSVKQLTGIKK